VDSAPIAFVGVSATCVVVADERIGTVATATTPFEIALRLLPLTRHVTLPVLVAQLRVLLAAVRAEPAAKVIGPRTFVGYASVHCNPAGDAEALRLTFSETDLPGAALAPDKLRVAV
jgi:hypothetical protein